MAIGGGDGSIILSTKIDESGLKKGFGSIEKMASMAGKAFLAIGAAAATATVAITKMAVSAYADYEQLVGGVETLFKDSAGKVLEYANEAYRTTGLSANEYMASVTSFSASLLSSLGGDTEKAADVANAALISMSDNANKMGSSMESIQMAFQGFAKGQYMLLDNLKLGYGGTKTEMERLLKDAQAITGVEYNIDNLADVYTAIGVIQEKLGIAGTTAKEAATTISGSAAMMKASWQNVLAAIAGGGDLDRAIQNLVDSISIYFKNIVPVVERSLLGIGQMVASVAPLLVQTVAKALIKAIPSLLYAVYQMIIGIAKGIYEGIKALFSGEAEKVLTEQAEQVKQTAKNQNEVTTAVKETNKELKKTLAGFDDIQILSSQTAESAETMGNEFLPSTVTSAATGEATSPEVDTSKYQEIASAIKTTLADILMAASNALLAVGLIVLFSGNILGGIGLIMAGAAAYVAGDTVGSENPLETLKGHLETLEEYLVPALLGLGVLLLFLGMIPLGIGLILGGIAYWGYKEMQSNEYDTASFQEKLNVLMEAVSLGLVAIGVLLIFFGHIPLGIGLIIGGKSLLGATEEKLNEGEVTTKIQKFFKDNQKLFVGVGLALVVIGLLLLFTPAAFPISLGLILAGAGLLATEADINRTRIVDDIKTFLFKNSTLISMISGGLLILGIILCATGVALPLGIALIAAGAVGLVTVTALNHNSIMDWVKGVWDAVKGFWNQHIAPVFTLTWWQNLAIKCGNGLIAGFEGAVNGIVSMFEKMINLIVKGINKISFDLPDWLGGGHFGFNLSEVQLQRVSIPRLAQGTVVPANSQFSSGISQTQNAKDIASLQSMMTGVITALSQQNMSSASGNTEVVLEIDGREFGRAVVEQGNRENRRIGTRLVIA